MLQFRETVRGRHGVMLLGPPASAKTTVYRTLAKALTAQQEESDVVDAHVINPRSLEMNQLYGSFDQISHDFTDGVLGLIYRSCASEQRSS